MAQTAGLYRRRRLHRRQSATIARRSRSSAMTATATRRCNPPAHGADRAACPPAVLIGDVIDLHKIEAAGLADSLDGLAAGMFLVDAIGRSFTPQSGHAMLSDAAVVRVAAGRLATNDPPRTARSRTSSPRRRPATPLSASKASPYRLQAPAGEDTSPMSCRSLRRRAARRAWIYAAVAAVFVTEGEARPRVAAGRGQPAVSTSPPAKCASSSRSPASATSPRGRRRSASRRDLPQPSSPPFREDRDDPPGRPGQARRRLHQPAPAVVPVFEGNRGGPPAGLPRRPADHPFFAALYQMVEAAADCTCDHLIGMGLRTRRIAIGERSLRLRDARVSARVDGNNTIT